MFKTIILVDEPTDNDHRVLSSIKKYETPIVIDCKNIIMNNTSQKNDIIHYIMIFLELIQGLGGGIISWWKLYYYYNIKPKSLLSGLKKTIIDRYRSKKITEYIQNKYEIKNIDIVHAHDFFCAQIGASLCTNKECNLIYDAHEVEFHRNRKNSFLRVVFEIYIEKKITKIAKQIIVVNHPIKQLYHSFYKINNSKLKIINNNHFKLYSNYAVDHYTGSNKSTILYIGSAIHGRMLEHLNAEIIKSNSTVSAFFLSHTPNFINHHWILGNTNYLESTLQIVQEKKVAMWCCNENICLSYQLSLSNKFFQAIAIGIPVIVFENSYMAEIVKKYQIGFVYDLNNFYSILESLNDETQYRNLLNSISTFQYKLYVENLEL